MIVESETQNIPSIYAMVHFQRPRKKGYVSLRTVQRQWSKIMKECEKSGLPITAPNLIKLVDGVIRFGRTGEHHHRFTDDTEKFFVDFLWSMRDIGMVVTD